MTTDFIDVRDSQLSRSVCRQLIERFEQSKATSPGATGGGVDETKKKSTDLMLTGRREFADLMQPVLQATSTALVDYVSQHHLLLDGAIGITMAHPKTGQPTPLSADNFDEVGRPQASNLLQYLYRLGRINMQRYRQDEGGYPHWHSEIYPQAQGNEALHRVLLWMFYLNDVAEGGETDFYYQDKSIRPQAGRMVIAPAGFTHSHRGRKPISHDKYIITSWVLFNRAEQIYQTSQPA